MMEATYVNVFSDRVVCKSKAKFDPDEMVCTVLETAPNVDKIPDPDDLTDEYVQLVDGTCLREYDGVQFEW